jgi:hypothetical protein
MENCLQFECVFSMLFIQLRSKGGIYNDYTTEQKNSGQNKTKNQYQHRGVKKYTNTQPDHLLSNTENCRSSFIKLWSDWRKEGPMMILYGSLYCFSYRVPDLYRLHCTT